MRKEIPVANRCPNVADLPGVAELPAGDPTRKHLEECPRCQSRLATYREFLGGKGDCDPGLLQKSVDQLGHDLDRRIFGNDQPSVQPVSAPFLRWRSPVVRGALAVAASLLLFFAVDGFLDDPGRYPPQLRSDQSGGLKENPLMAVTNSLADGGIELSWQPLSEADSYLVEILDARFKPQVELPVSGQTNLTLPLTRLKEILPQPGPYAWVVIALKNGDEILRSEPAAFTFGSD